MMRLRRVSGIVTLSLLTPTTMACAEGASVLWKHSYEVWVDSNKADRLAPYSALGMRSPAEYRASLEPTPPAV